MKAGVLRIGAAAAFIAAAGSATALERHYIKKDEVFCDSTGILCLRGTIAYEPNHRILSLNARLQKQTGPGQLRLGFSGSNRQGLLRHTEIVLRIRGTYSEIVDHRIRPDAPDVDTWALQSFSFEKDDQHDQRRQ